MDRRGTEQPTHAVERYVIVPLCILILAFVIGGVLA
jgi:hypothetical protein